MKIFFCSASFDLCENVWTDCVISVFQSKCTDQEMTAAYKFVGISPGIPFTSQGLNYSSYTIKFHKVPPGGDKTLHWGSCTPTQTQRREGNTEDCAGWAEAPSLVESSLQDALEREGDKLEALA